MPDDPNRVRDIFQVAAELPAAERLAYLAEACGPDADLRVAVERLLVAHVDPASVLEPRTNPAGPVAALRLPVTDPHTPRLETGTVLANRYKLLEPVGEGGMGTVWSARQTDPIKRMVAVKLIKPGMDSKAVLARFEAERQALALMDHPNIARVLDAGATADGRPFFVMELVKGVPITQFCDTRKLTPHERLDLFVPVCQAIQHAHQKGIIHRDIKPSNVLVTLYDDRPVPKVIDFGVAKATGQPLTEQTFNTGFGTVVGTVQYMSPEQATFNNLDVDTRSDLYSLGVLLYELLVGSPPFTKKDLEQAGVLEMLRVVREVEPPRPSTKLSTADALPSLAANRSTEPKKLTGMLRNELDWVVMKAMEKDRTRRYETANGFAADVMRYLSGEPVQAVPPSVGYRLRKFMRKNRWPVTAAAVVVVVLVGAGIAAFQFQRTLASTELNAERKRLDDLREADLQRAADLRSADEVAKREQEATRRETRAASLVQSLASADTAGVPRLLTDLAEFRDLTGPKLRELAAQPVTTKPGLHARMALLADEPRQAGELAAYLPACRPEELLPVRSLLMSHAVVVAPGLWAVLTDANAGPGKRVRAASALAGLAPEDERWKRTAPVVGELVTRENPLEAVVWSQALAPVSRDLLPALVERYPVARLRIRSGKLSESDLVAEASGFDLTANLLARYVTDRPDVLAGLAVIIDARHHRLFSPTIEANRKSIVPALREELGRVALVGPNAVGGVVSAVVGSPSSLRRLDPDPVYDAAAKRRANAAAVLLALEESESVWPLFRFPADGDPSARSYLQERLAGIGVDPVVLIQRFRVEPDVSAKRALLIALGDYERSPVWAVEREALSKELLTHYRDHPDAGLHGAIDWLLRQNWGKGAELAAIDEEQGSAARGRVAARVALGAVPVPGMAGAMGVVCGPLLPAPGVGRDRDWYVNGQEQTYTVIRRPKEFTLGSPETEPGRVPVRVPVNEPAHRKRIGRSFAMATKEVTVEQFLRFKPNHSWLKRYSPDRDSPAVGMTWYEAVEYCNWLSEKEGIPENQWCYERNAGGKYGAGMKIKRDHLKLTGYRLPTEAEWEYACRGGAVVGRYYGRTEELLPRYGWYQKNAEDHAWPVGRLRPNDLGLFDTLGNALEWVEDAAQLYDIEESGDQGTPTFLQVNEQQYRLLRGGSFFLTAVYLRCAIRPHTRPSDDAGSYGFRPSRTSPD